MKKNFFLEAATLAAILSLPLSVIAVPGQGKGQSAGKGVTIPVSTHKTVSLGKATKGSGDPGSGNKAHSPFKSGSGTLSKHIHVSNASIDAKFERNVNDAHKVITSGDPNAHISIHGGVNKSVYIRGQEEHVLEMESFIKALDKPVVQVRIDVIILLATKNYNFDLGFDWSGIYNRESSITASNTSFGLAGIGGRITDFPAQSSAAVDNTATTGSKVFDPKNAKLFVNPADFALNLFTKAFKATTSSSTGDSFVKIPLIFGGPDLNLRRLNLVLNAAESEKKVKIVSRPSIMTGSDKEATVVIGQKLPMQKSTVNTVGSTSAIYKGNSVDYLDIGIELKVKATINKENRSIAMDVNVTDTQKIGGSTTSNSSGIMSDPPILSTLSINNHIVLKNGQTTVIGGLSKKESSQIKNQLPIVSKLPIFGKLFKAKFNSDTEEEQFIFITPTIIEQSV